MGIEIERKFLVKDIFVHFEHTDSIYYSEINIRQGYFNKGRIRIRIISSGIYEEDERAFLTIKSKREHISRYEFEYEIPLNDAYSMMDLFCKNIISKTRYSFKDNDKRWEVDFFNDDNDGLVLAEVELESEEEKVVLPKWVGKEVSGDKRYYNKYLSKNPYSKWKENEG